MTQPSRRERREAVVREHLLSENEKEFGRTLATFDHPRYELMATGQVFDGPDEVMRYYESSRGSFPDQHSENVELHHGEDLVVVEFDLVGTHLGPYQGFEPTGLGFRSRMVALFFFDEDDRIVRERVYFDVASIAVQLGLS